MASIPTLRKAYGALKDRTTVSLAQINNEYKDLEVAIVKATNHAEHPPKEKHMRRILIATSGADIAYCIHTLAGRLGKTRNWIVALKALIVIHRLLKEGDPSFKEEFLNFSQRGLIPNLSNFKDDSSRTAWDCSAWVRTYAMFIEERLECFRVLKYDIETKPLPKHSQEPDMVDSKMIDLDNEQLLEQLPSLQQLMCRLVGCRPEGAAVGNNVIQYALALVLKESFKIYCGINDRVINLIDKYFQMTNHEAFKAIEIYRRSIQLTESLTDFYDVCKGLELTRNFQFPVLKELPSSFLVTMEEYLREAPRIIPVSTTHQLELTEKLQLTYYPTDQSVADNENNSTVEETSTEHSGNVAASHVEVASPVTPTNNMESVDLLGLSDLSPTASAIEQSNALALAIVPTDSASSSAATAFNKSDPTGWELALFTAPSSDISAPVEQKFAGGMDSLTLNSLYDASYRINNHQQPIYGSPAPNPFMTEDPFAMSNNIAAPIPVQMAAMSHQQMSPWGQYVTRYPGSYAQVQQHHASGPTNPFGDPLFNQFPAQNSGFQPATSNPFGSTSLL